MIVIAILANAVILGISLLLIITFGDGWLWQSNRKRSALVTRNPDEFRYSPREAGHKRSFQFPPLNEKERSAISKSCGRRIDDREFRLATAWMKKEGRVYDWRTREFLVRQGNGLVRIVKQINEAGELVKPTHPFERAEAAPVIDLASQAKGLVAEIPAEEVGSLNNPFNSDIEDNATFNPSGSNDPSTTQEMRSHSIEKDPSVDVKPPELDEPAFWSAFWTAQHSKSQKRREDLLVAIKAEDNERICAALERYVCLKLLLLEGPIDGFGQTFLHYLHFDEVRAAFRADTSLLVLEVETEDMGAALHAAAMIMVDPDLGIVDRVVCSAFIREREPATGQKSERFICSLHLDRDEARNIEFEHIDALACIESLKGRIARRPRNAVAPFLRVGDAKLDVSPDADLLADLSATEFEHLVARLLTAYGLETERTKGSWDGGIDCIAIDPRPLVGGKVLVQAKRYAGTVSASAVRDLYGTMVSEGAGKGVLITTGSFGPSSFRFAANKPIELIDGSALSKLLDKTRAKG